MKDMEKKIKKEMKKSIKSSLPPDNYSLPAAAEKNEPPARFVMHRADKLT